MQFLQLVSVRLFLVLAALLFGAFAIYVEWNFTVHREHLEKRMTEGASRISDIILRATRHAMIDNSRDDVIQIITSIGEQPQVDAVRIYSKAGEVVVSTDASEVGHRVDTEAEACAVCHIGGNLRDGVATHERTRQFASPSGHMVLGMISPIRNEPGCSSVNCHARPEEQAILGVLDLQLSLEQDQADLQQSRSEMIWSATVVSLITALTAGLFIAVVVHRPVRELIRGTQSIARLDLDVKLNGTSWGEVGDLARSFEHMAQELRRAQRENEQLASSLETKVQEKTRELERARSHLVHNEKMASLGKLSAVIAHEINNPLAGIFTYARLISRRLRHDSLDDEAQARLCEHVEMIESETRRCGETVKNLLLFSKLEPGAMGQVKVSEIIQRAARLLQHSLDLNQVTLDVDLGIGDDRVSGNPDRLQQTLVALMVNASEAMPDGGRLGVTLDSSTDEHITISVSDTGTGISEELQSSIFEPFFTTKDGQGGVGLGLAIVHGIVRRHGGTITLESSPMSGTTFHVTLPRTPPEDPSLSRRQPEP